MSEKLHPTMNENIRSLILFLWCCVWIWTIPIFIKKFTNVLAYQNNPRHKEINW
jgi:hypothetical protein